MIPPIDLVAQTKIDMSDSCNCSTSCCMPKRRIRHKKTCPEHEKKVQEQAQEIIEIKKN